VKLSIYHKDNAEAIVNEWFTDKWKDKFKIASAGVMWMDVTGLTADKGNSLKKLQAILGITREETMAFGDNLNDLGLLDAAEESYAIGSARDEVKKAAKHVAPPLDEFGESEVLLQLLKELEV
jgi:hydroxymethylpyrimidine pyrophosphatase-like HAD family hydrolase